MPLFSFRTVLGKNGPKVESLLRVQDFALSVLVDSATTGLALSNVCLYRNGRKDEVKSRLCCFAASDLEASSQTNEALVREAI